MTYVNVQSQDSLLRVDLKGTGPSPVHEVGEVCKTKLGFLREHVGSGEQQGPREGSEDAPTGVRVLHWEAQNGLPLMCRQV